MRLTKAEREQLRGMFNGRCAYCGADLGERWHADHVESVGRNCQLIGNAFVFDGTLRNPEADTLENLFPSCAPCNIDKGPDGIEVWRERLGRSAAMLRRDVPKFRHAERFGIVSVSSNPVRFYFETQI